MYIEWAVAPRGWISLTCYYILSRLLCGGASSVLCVRAAEIARRSKFNHLSLNTSLFI